MKAIDAITLFAARHNPTRLPFEMAIALFYQSGQWVAMGYLNGTPTTALSRFRASQIERVTSF